MDDVEVQKEGARLESMEPVRETVGEVASEGGVHSWDVEHPKTKLGQCTFRGWDRCQEGSALPCRDDLSSVFQ